MAKFTILGMGGFGLALAVMLNNFGHDVIVWSAFKQEIDDIRRDGENKQKLPGIKISDEIILTDDLCKACSTDIIIFGVPTKFVRSVAKQVAPYLSKDTIIVNTSKGLEEETLKRMSEVIEEELPQNPIVVLTGPSHAEEVALGVPTTVVVTSKDMQYADHIQSVCDGMGLGDNTKAALMTRGITEIARLGVALGAKDETFAGLTGIGDLIVTCTSMHSRNRRAGILIGQGISPVEAVERVGTVEGYICTKTAYELAKKVGIDMPITEQCNNVLFNGLNVKSALINLMGRPKRHETETIWVD